MGGWNISEGTCGIPSYGEPCYGSIIPDLETSWSIVPNVKTSWSIVPNVKTSWSIVPNVKTSWSIVPKLETSCFAVLLPSSTVVGLSRLKASQFRAWGSGVSGVCLGSGYYNPDKDGYGSTSPFNVYLLRDDEKARKFLLGAAPEAGQEATFPLVKTHHPSNSKNSKRKITTGISNIEGRVLI